MFQFLKKICTVALGVATFYIIAIGILLLYITASNANKKYIPKKNTMLYIHLSGQAAEYIPDDPIKNIYQTKAYFDLKKIQHAIDQATQDENIQGVYLQTGDNLEIGWANLEELRNTLIEFKKKSGKLIVAYGEQYTQKNYYLASVADHITLHPEGMFLMNGLKKNVTFYHNFFKKLEVEPVVFRVGDYKSAVEPFIRTNMSEKSKQQSEIYLWNIYSHYLKNIASARKINKKLLQKSIDNLQLFLPKTVHKLNLIDQIGYTDEVEKKIKQQLQLIEKDKIHYVSSTVYSNYQQFKEKKRISHKIAVLIAEGDIINGKSIPGSIGAKNFIKTIRKIKKDSTIKAVVLRINSPGGSSIASDAIWHELMCLHKKKPLIASMADVAASGGYYLAMACDKIIAQPTTITGSIGVFGLFFNTGKFFENKLGITTDVIKTGQSADIFDMKRALTLHEKKMIQQFVDQGYQSFITKVAQCRNLPLSKVKKIASGKVWTGKLAQQHGLVDELGGLKVAINMAAHAAQIQDNYTLTYWPEPINWLAALLDFNVNTWIYRFSNYYLGDYQQYQKLWNMKGIQAKMVHYN